MNKSFAEVYSKVEDLLISTRAIKKFMKFINKSHERLENDYSRLISVYEHCKSTVFSNEFKNHIVYMRNFLDFNEEVIRGTRVAHNSLKRLSLEIKSKLEILKIEKKSISQMKNNKYENQVIEIIGRCNELESGCYIIAKDTITQAVNSHLYALKHVLIGSIISVKSDDQFSAELEQSTTKRKSENKKARDSAVFNSLSQSKSNRKAENKRLRDSVMMKALSQNETNSVHYPNTGYAPMKLRSVDEEL